MASAAFAQTTDTATKTILQRAMTYQFQFRGGQTDVVPDYVAMLEEATKTDPENAELWNAMGVAYLAQAARAMMPGGRPPDALAAMPKGTSEGIAKMNRAIELAPTSRRVRLQRAFSGINLPDALRNHATEAEDLDFLIGIANGTRAGDYLRLLRGDLYAETGSSVLARAQFELVATSLSPASGVAAARLVAMDQGGVPAADIKKLRAQAGTNCLMCHGK